MSLSTTPAIVDPDATLDWAFDWTAWLEDTETITSHTVTATEGSATIGSTDETGGVVKAWVSNVAGVRTKLTCEIVTSMGRIDDRSILLKAVDR